MLSAEMNERMTRVGPGTPMGELLRRYWHPVAATIELGERHTKKVRILGEDLALFRDGSGRYGLLAENCPHRRVSLVYGVPEEEGIRCAYHGWMFDTEGNCLEQPAESANSTFKSRVRTVAYPVRELGGLLWAYLGPAPVPILPRFDYLVQANTLRQIARAELPCNFLQVMENSLDPIHSEWLHTWYAYYLRNGTTHSPEGGFPQRRHAKIGFDTFRFGITKRRFYVGGSEQDNDWQIGHPILFPSILKQGDTLQIRVPIDDETTIHYLYTAISYPGVEAPQQDSVPMYDYPYRADDGGLLTAQVPHQDFMAWITQGPIADRTVEHLGASDRGVLVYRKLLQEQMLKVADGEDPIGVLRDPADDVQIDIPVDAVVPPLTATSVRSMAGVTREGASAGAGALLAATTAEARDWEIDREAVARQIRSGQHCYSPVIEDMIAMRLAFLEHQLSEAKQQRAG